MGEGKLTPLTPHNPWPTVTKYCTRHYAHHISPCATFGQGRPSGYLSPYSQTCHSFKKIYLYAKSLHRPRAQVVEPILTQDTPSDAYSRRVVFFGVRTQYFQTFTLRTPKKPFFGTYNGKPMAKTYLHNCMMHRDTMLKFGTLFDLAKYVEHT